MTDHMVHKQKVMKMSENSMSANQSAAINALIEKAKAAAEARRIAKANAEENLVDEESDENTIEDEKPVAKKTKAVREKKEKVVKVKKNAEIVKIEREQIKAKLLRERAERKENKAKMKALKSAVDEPKAVHMKKVEKAAAQLPKMSESLKEVFDNVISQNLTEGQVAILCAHLAHHNRVRATIRSRETQNVFEVGQTVEIISSDNNPRLIGKRGTVTEVRKIRIFVDVGTTNPAYLFTADVVPVTGTIDIDEEEVVETVQTDEEVLPEFITGTDNE